MFVGCALARDVAGHRRAGDDMSRRRPVRIPIPWVTVWSRRQDGPLLTFSPAYAGEAVFWRPHPPR